MSQVIIDLAGCSGTEPPYVMASRATSLEGLMVLRNFERKQICKRWSDELRKEFSRLMYLKWKTIADTGEEEEIANAVRTLQNVQGNAAKGMKRKMGTGVDQWGRSKRQRN